MEHQEIALSPLFQEQVLRASDHLGAVAESPGRGLAFHRTVVAGFARPSDSNDLDSVAEAVFLVWWQAICAWYPTVPLSVDTQRVVDVAGRRYRLDFAIRIAGYCQRLAVEIDGHAFHERSLEQVTYRNSRDRDLQVAGWVVLHFSFEELMTTPHLVVDDVFTEASRAWARAVHTEEPVL